jgi:hypothetical protein
MSLQPPKAIRIFQMRENYSVQGQLLMTNQLNFNQITLKYLYSRMRIINISICHILIIYFNLSYYDAILKHISLRRAQHDGSKQT